MFAVATLFKHQQTTFNQDQQLKGYDTLMLISDDHMYGLINGFLLLKPSLDVVNVPEFYKLFNSSAMEVSINNFTNHTVASFNPLYSGVS